MTQAQAVDENIRRACDVLEKWGRMIWSKLELVQDEMKAVGLKHPDSIMAGDMFVMNYGDGHFFKINVNGDWMEPHHALHNPYFDIETLSKIRILAFEKLKEFWGEIEKAKVHLEKSRAERDQKVKTVLPAIIDEFGADVMQHGTPQPEKMAGYKFLKPDHATVFSHFTPKPLKVDIGSGGGSVAVDPEMSKKLDELQRRLDNMTKPDSDCRVKL